MKKTLKQKIEIEIDGKKYPCYQTMGALLLFEREAGKEVSKITTSITDQCLLLWACCKSASRREGIDFPYSAEDFADNLFPDDVLAAVNRIIEEKPHPALPEEGGSEKKA